jgi:hypothetical protein
MGDLKKSDKGQIANKQILNAIIKALAPQMGGWGVNWNGIKTIMGTIR